MVQPDVGNHRHAYPEQQHDGSNGRTRQECRPDRTEQQEAQHDDEARVEILCALQFAWRSQVQQRQRDQRSRRSGWGRGSAPPAG